MVGWVLQRWQHGQGVEAIVGVVWSVPRTVCVDNNYLLQVTICLQVISGHSEPNDGVVERQHMATVKQILCYLRSAMVASTTWTITNFLINLHKASKYASLADYHR